MGTRTGKGGVLAYALQQLINGISLGMIYGLIAVGYTMVYGIIGMINFAHGDIFMVGAFVALIAITLLTTGGVLDGPAGILLALAISMAWAPAATAQGASNAEPEDLDAPAESAADTAGDGEAIIVTGSRLAAPSTEVVAIERLVANVDHR